jgi:hypothetical protein
MTAIWLAGKDRTADLLPGLDRAVAGHDPALAGQAARQAPIAALRDAPTEAEELDRWLSLLRAHGAVRTDAFDAPARPGFAGRLMRRFKRLAWGALRYQHDRVAVQQNAVNLQILLALEASRQELRRECQALRDRIAALETRLPPEGRP